MVKPIYSIALNRITQMIIPKPKENMMINRDAITAIIIRANSEIGKPKIIARFRMFL